MVAILVGVTAVTLASTASPLDEGRALYRALRFRQAAEQLRHARERPELSVDERREVHDLLARACAALGQLEEAEEAYRELLEKDPHAPSPEGAAPKITEAFERAKERLYPRSHVRLVPQSAAGTVRAFELVDPWHRVQRVVIAAHGAVAIERVVEVVDHRLTVDLTTLSFDSGRLEARGPDGERLAVLEQSFALEPRLEVVPLGPPQLEAPAPAQRPANTRRVFAWALAGGFVAAGASATALALSAGQDARAAQAAHFASDARTLDGRAHDKALAANVLFGAAALGAAASVALFWEWE